MGICHTALFEAVLSDCEGIASYGSAGSAAYGHLKASFLKKAPPSDTKAAKSRRDRAIDAFLVRHLDVRVPFVELTSEAKGLAYTLDSRFSEMLERIHEFMRCGPGSAQDMG